MGIESSSEEVVSSYSSESDLERANFIKAAREAIEAKINQKLSKAIKTL
jgi:hypothetical protein